MKYQVSLGNKIKNLRKKKGLTVADLAERTDLDAGYLSKVENAARLPSLPAVYRIAESLGVDAADIVGAREGTSASANQEAAAELTALFKGRSAAEKADILAVLRLLRTPGRAKALRDAFKR